jgi:hypothetical protein
MNGDDNDVFKRWSRRKLAGDPAPPADPVQDTPPEPETSEADWLAAHDLPDPDDMGEGDDFGAYLKEGVPDLLRRRALRQLWKSNPTLANLDGLIDYGEDFTDAAMVPDVLATAYKVGRGMIAKVLDDAEDPERDLEEEPFGLAEQGAVDEEVETIEETVIADQAAPPAVVDYEPEEIEEEFRPRRMTFIPD